MEARDGVPRDWRTWRRFQALRLKQEGWYQRSIAVALDVSEVSVSHWCTRAAAGGPEALLTHRSPGRPPELSPDQIRMIPEFLWHGAEAYGFRGQVWTCGRVAKAPAAGGGRACAGRLDGSPIHRADLVRQFVSQAKEKVRLEPLPGYSPDLNPWDEGGLEPPEERRDAEPRVQGPGGTTRTVLPRFKPRQTQTTAGTFVLYTGRLDTTESLNFTAQRSVIYNLDYYRRYAD